MALFEVENSMNRMRKSNQRGFTLVELSIALSFVAAILIAIIMVTIQIANMYNRGITLKGINQAGRSLASETQNSIANTPPFSVDPSLTGKGARYVKQSYGGRLCLGQYSYIWNYGRDINTNPSPAVNDSLNNYDDYKTASHRIRFVKIFDQDSKYCERYNNDDAIGGKYINHKISVELLDADKYNLVLHYFTITSKSTAIDTRIGQQLYNVGFVIGTNDSDSLIYDSSGTRCKTSGDGADLLYCAINRFDVTARAGNNIDSK
jgi:hypothetical protein